MSKSYGLHAHRWRAMDLSMNDRGHGGIAACSCGEIQIMTERAWREFEKQLAYGIEPKFDDEGIRPVVIRVRSGRGPDALRRLAYPFKRRSR